MLPPELIEKARGMDLLTYLKMYDPDELVHISGSEYTTSTHDSLKISNGKWHWFSGESAEERRWIIWSL